MAEDITRAASDSAPTPATASQTTENPLDTDTAGAPAGRGDPGDPAADAPARPARSFAAMNLLPEVQRALDEMGYDEPMEVQVAVYDSIVAGRDVMAQARTGTGKTAAFGIPIAQMLDPSLPAVQALILAPTRELALQVSMELSHIGRYRGLTVVPVYGGAPIGKQIDALRAGAQVVAGTPGRVLDHIGRKTLKTESIRLLVLDECDEMLSMGFQEEIEKIISHLPGVDRRQTLLFSATIPEDIERIARRHMREPEMIQLSSDDDISVDQIEHSYYVVSGMARTRDLLKVLEVEQPHSAIIFCNTREDTTTVAAFLRKHGYDAEAISSDLSQRDRERVMQRMRDKNLRFLVATDVAARGIDIQDLSHVINYTFPESPEVYVHRTGRTGRAGNEGKAISLVGPREIGAFYYLKLLYKIRPIERDLPSDAELATLREGQRYREVVARVTREPSAEYRSLARRLWQSPEGERVVAALLQDLLERDDDARPASGDRPTREARRTDAHRATGRDDRPGDRRARERKRRRRRERDERGETTAAAPARDGDAAAAPRVPSDGDAGTAAAADADAAPRADGGERKRKRRRRTRRDTAADPAAGSAAGRSAAAGARDFWEAWADEKTVADRRPPVPIADASGDGAPGADARGEESTEGTVRLYVNVGRREDLRADGVRALLADGLAPEIAERLGKVQVRNTHCYVRVPEDIADAVIAAAAGKQVGDRALVVERAKR
ncbi:MAG: DEAD/DEAH box helicase [Deltaproteobacteria bacterium]|nr:MAG: DEAD/DEAH box helicase [Deltaproteobacteria bacterium]